MSMSKSALSPPPSLSLLQSPIPWLRAFWRFSRPHTILGTSLSILGLFAIVWAARHSLGLPTGTLYVWQWGSALWLTWLTCMCTNIYIVGLNQIEDVTADCVNKPYLPLASGAFSLSQARILVGLACGGAILLASVSHSFYLVATVGLSLVIGTAYSLPPLRLKRFPLLASCCALLVRGAVVNLGLFLHAASQLGLLPQVPSRVWVLTMVVLAFSVAIALFRGLRNSLDPSQYVMDIGSVQLGSVGIFRLVWWWLTACYGSLIIAAAFIPAINTGFLIGAHGLALVYFWYLGRHVRLLPNAATSVASKELSKELSYGDFYQFLWKLLFIEYLIFPTACFLA